MSECAVCGGRTDARLCNLHTRDLEKALAEMPALLAELDVTITRQDVGTGAPLFACARRYVDSGYEEGTTTLPATPWPFAWDAANLRWGIDNTLSTWLRHLAESRGLAVSNLLKMDQWQRVIDATTLARILLGLLDSIRYDEAADQIYDEILWCQREAMRAIDRQAPDVFLGRCEALVVEVKGDAVIAPVECGADLMAHSGAGEVKCQRCGAVFDVLTLVQHLPELDDAWARPHIIAGALSTIDDDLPASTLRTWIERDERAAKLPIHKQPPYPLILQKGIDDDRKPLYRVGDVRARLAWAKNHRRDTPKTGNLAEPLAV